MIKEASKTILVTGGTGFIGSHICVELLMEGFDIIVADNLTNSNIEVIERIKHVTGKKPIIFYKTDIRDREALEKIFTAHKIYSVIHCAGLKSVEESVRNPLLYYDNNVYGSVVLVQTMAKYDVKRIVFSSSACVYGGDAPVPYTETSLVKPVNPYGKSKLLVEEILRDIALSDPEWRVAILRYFNPIGAHPSGLIGEYTNMSPNNLIPRICQVASGFKPELLIFGNDYNTPDGTAIRDYIHVVDLALGHAKALRWFEGNAGVLVSNLGIGKGVSVLELLGAFSRIIGRDIPYRFVSRRDGDTPCYYADVTCAKKQLGWSASRSIDEACKDAWRWQQSRLQDSVVQSDQS